MHRHSLHAKAMLLDAAASTLRARWRETSRSARVPDGVWRFARVEEAPREGHRHLGGLFLSSLKVNVSETNYHPMKSPTRPLYFLFALLSLFSVFVRPGVVATEPLPRVAETF